VAWSGLRLSRAPSLPVLSVILSTWIRSERRNLIHANTLSTSKSSERALILYPDRFPYQNPRANITLNSFRVIFDHTPHSSIATVELWPRFRHFPTQKITLSRLSDSQILGVIFNDFSKAFFSKVTLSGHFANIPSFLPCFLGTKCFLAISTFYSWV